jgi:hypothetical protein
MTDFVQVLWPIAAVAAYYLVVWLWWGRDPKPGTMVTLYEPPRGMSPGLMRYCWKQRFDERVVWAGLANLVWRGLAVFETREDGTYIRPVWPPQRKPVLPREEAALYEELATANGRRGVRLAMTDELMAKMTVRMALRVMQQERGRWFVENRESVLAGGVLSIAGLLLAARPSSLEQIAVLVLPSPIMAVSAFYLYFLVQRIAELARVAENHFTKAIAGRMTTMLFFAMSCLAGIWFGAIFIYAVLGWKVLVVMAAMTGINLLFLYLMKSPTREGRKLLDEIEGFRHFLEMVEHLPMDRPEAPDAKRGLYEEYLPYALALEVEQKWCDQVAAVASSARHYEALERGTVYHLGMWDGRPVDVAITTRVK